MNWLRYFAEVTTRRLVFRRRLPGTFAESSVYVTTAGGLRFLLRSSDNWDPVLFRLASSFVKRDSVVWDVGANLGLFSFAAAANAGPNGLVIAIEADTWLVEILRRSAAAQPLHAAPVKILPCAAADEMAIRNFHIAKRARSANFLEGFGSTQTGGTRRVQCVVTVPLDWLTGYFPLPALIKIDVEEAELEVLRGATRLLREVRPTIICEVSSATAKSVTVLLKEHGYRLYDGEHDPQCKTPLGLATWSTVALPPAAPFPENILE